MVFGVFYADYQGFTRRLRSLARCRLPQRHRVHCGGIAAAMYQATQLKLRGRNEPARGVVAAPSPYSRSSVFLANISSGLT
jgi:hypothetical protein